MKILFVKLFWNQDCHKNWKDTQENNIFTAGHELVKGSSIVNNEGVRLLNR